VTLIVEAYRRDPESGAMIDLGYEAGEQLAGFENWRHIVWGAAVMRDLGMTLLPSLTTISEIHAEGADLDRLEAELGLVAAHLSRITEATGVNPDTFGRRIANLRAAVARARQVEGGSGGVYIG
jgi:hypothetical protein